MISGIINHKNFSISLLVQSIHVIQIIQYCLWSERKKNPSETPFFEKRKWRTFFFFFFNLAIFLFESLFL